MPFEGVNLVKREVSLAERLHALHDIQQPAARFRRFASEKDGLLPVGEDEFFRANDAILDNVNFPGVRELG